MTGAINTINSSLGAASSVNVPSPAPSSDTTSSATTAAPLKNPQVIQDPMAGFITQYLDKNGGNIVSQTPSAATVAYLRQGLTADGMPKHSSSTSVAATA